MKVWANAANFTRCVNGKINGKGAVALKRNRKILSILIKILVGIGSFLVIWLRLRDDFTPEKTALLYDSAISVHGLICFAVCVALIPINWGLESWKWRMITYPIEPVSFRTASKSVYAGICLGNLAPGRATEFLARIIYFHIENRPRITVLHFVGGLFQLSVTIIVGFVALAARIKGFGDNNAWMLYAIVAGGLVLLTGLIIAIWKIEPVMRYISSRINKANAAEEFEYRFTPQLITKLFSLSFLRYAVFSLQFVLILMMFWVDAWRLPVLSGISLYFLITATLPMISVIEAAIRAAVALIVFEGTAISPTILALSSVLVWMVNIIIPSIVGYYFLVRKKFNFKLFGRRK